MNEKSQRQEIDELKALIQAQALQLASLAEAAQPQAPQIIQIKAPEPDIKWPKAEDYMVPEGLVEIEIEPTNKQYEAGGDAGFVRRKMVRPNTGKCVICDEDIHKKLGFGAYDTLSDDLKATARMQMLDHMRTAHSGQKVNLIGPVDRNRAVAWLMGKEWTPEEFAANRRAKLENKLRAKREAS